MTADRVFGALSDATRRAILDLLREHQDLTAGEIAGRFKRISRPAVSKHLRVLREAGLVHAEERGRENHYRLDARPLAEIHRDWLDEFAPHWEQASSASSTTRRRSNNDLDEGGEAPCAASAARSGQAKRDLA